MPMAQHPKKAHPSPLASQSRGLGSQATEEVRLDTCFFTHHLFFAKDEDQTLWFSQGRPGSSNGVVGWVKMKTFFETGDSAKSQGWTPIVVDTNGDGKRDAYVEPNDPLDPAKDKRIFGAFYGIMPSPVDDTVSGQTMGIDFGRIDQPGFVMHIIPGANPSETALAELFVPPDGACATTRFRCPQPRTSMRRWPTLLPAHRSATRTRVSGSEEDEARGNDREQARSTSTRGRRSMKAIRSPSTPAMARQRSR
jgi:hypothetical protein